MERIVRLHVGLVRVHPFFDGNGLLARVLLAVQTAQYLGAAVLLPRNDPTYFAALRKACDGNLSDLSADLRLRLQKAAQQQHAADGARAAADTERYRVIRHQPD